MIGLSTESDKVKDMINDFSSTRTSEIIADLIKDDLSSEVKKEMSEGVKYYSGDNTFIKSKNFNVANIGGENVLIQSQANNKLAHRYFAIIVDQKTYYINAPEFLIENEQIKEDLQEILGEFFDDLLDEVKTGASKKGCEFLHPYITPEGELEFTIFPSTQIIPIYDTKFQKELVSAIRYYPYQLKDNKGTKELYKVEIYDQNFVYYYTEISEGNFSLDAKESHFFSENTVWGTDSKSWGKVPLIELANNPEKRSDLYLGKSILDDYDLHKSVFSNNLEDIQQAFLHIQGYDLQGANSAERANEAAAIAKTIRTLKMIFTNGENDGVNSVNQDIPHEAKDNHLERTRKELFTLFQAFDPQLVGDGNITNIVLKARYFLLDIKANKQIKKLRKFLREVLWFVSKYAELSDNYKTFDYKEPEISITKNQLFNEGEVIDNIMKSTDLSEETRLAKHPYVDDVQAELERKEKDAEAYQEVVNE